MTPLAASIAKQRMLPLAQRTFDDPCKMIDLVQNIHCFEVSEIEGVANDILDKMLDECILDKGKGSAAFQRMGGLYSFLPAEHTWIEWKTGNAGERMAFLLVGKDKAPMAVAFIVLLDGRGARSVDLPIEIGVGAHGGSVFHSKAWNEDISCDPVVIKNVLYIHVLLSLINSPKIIGRKQHMPNVALEKKFKKTSKTGFPLHAWTEIKLDISKPVEIYDGLPHEAHLTGGRARHFCRAHIRIKNGAVEFVSSHWRGTASLGIKNSRYRLVAEHA